jgi:hypothetical protein
MSFRYPAGLITASSPVNANYPSGVWTPRQALPYLQNNVWGQDPFFDQTVLLLHGDGTNGAQNNTFLDSSSNNFTITRNGNTTQGTFTPFSLAAGEWSNYFTGTSGLQVPNQTFSGNFTWECWYYPIALGSGVSTNYSVIFGCGDIAVQNLQLYVDLDGSVKYYNGSTTLITSAASIVVVNQWCHLALCRSGTTTTMYVNGVSRGSGTESNTKYINSVGNFLPFNSNYGVRGYVSNFRATTTAVYTSAFTPPTAPLTAISGTLLLLNQANRFVDASASPQAITLTGTPSVTPFSPFQPLLAYSPGVTGGSGYFDGSGDYLTVANNSAFDFAGGDFTIEGWFYRQAAVTQRIIAKRATGTGFGPFLIAIGGSGQVSFFASFNGTTNGLTLNSSVSANLSEWNHFAVTRSGSSWTLWLNGASVATNTNASSLVANTDAVSIGVGSADGTSGIYTGYLADIRFVKGTAVYTSAFTPPTAPVTNISNTSLLLNFTNAGIIDNTAKNNLETVGNAQIDTAVVKYGTGSMEFDGSGDYLSFISTPDTTLGTGNLTIEGWFNSNSISTLQTIIERRAALTARGIAIFIETSVLKLRAGDTSTGAWEVNIDSGTLSSSTWYYFALTRSGDTWRGFLNGTQIGSDVTWSGTVVDETSAWLIGAAFGGGAGMNGYIDDLRITKGIARYTANFVPPIARFPNQ